MVTLHDAIETIKNGAFVFFFEKKQKNRMKKAGGLFFWQKRVLLNPDCLLVLFVIFTWSHDLE